MEQNNPRQEQTQGQQQTNQTDAGQLGQNQSQIQNPKTPGNGPFGTGGATSDPNRRPGTNEEDNFRDDQNSDPGREGAEVMEPNKGNPYAPSDPGSPRDPAMNPPFAGEDMDESNMNPMPREPMN